MAALTAHFTPSTHPRHTPYLGCMCVHVCVWVTWYHNMVSNHRDVWINIDSIPAGYFIIHYE